MEKKFELFAGCLGNGTTICNKAVSEYGDHKKIGHISETGKITWYIKKPETYVPEPDMKKIQKWSQDARCKFLSRWEEISAIRKYEIMLNEMGVLSLLNRPLKERLKGCRELEEKVSILEKIYFEKNL